MCHLLLWPDRATLLSEYGKTIKPSPRRESFRIFFIWGKLLIYFSFYTFFWVCSPGSAPTFLVLADMCGRAWRITSSTPQHCRPLFKPTFFSVEEIRLCKVFLPDLAILIHRRGSIEVSRNPRSNKLHIPVATCPHPHTRARSQQSCVLLCVSKELFREHFLTFSSSPPARNWCKQFWIFKLLFDLVNPLSATQRAPSENYPDRSFNYITLWSC